MTMDKQIHILIKKVKKLTGEVKVLRDCLVEMNDYLDKQNDWLAIVAEILEGENDDDEYDKECEEWKDRLNPVNKRRKG